MEQPQLLILVVLVPTVQVGDPSLLAAVVEPPLPSPNMDLLRPSLARVLSKIDRNTHRYWIEEGKMGNSQKPKTF